MTNQSLGRRQFSSTFFGIGCLFLKILFFGCGLEFVFEIEELKINSNCFHMSPYKGEVLIRLEKKNSTIPIIYESRVMKNRPFLFVSIRMADYYSKFNYFHSLLKMATEKSVFDS